MSDKREIPEIIVKTAKQVDPVYIVELFMKYPNDMVFGKNVRAHIQDRVDKVRENDNI